MNYAILKLIPDKNLSRISTAYKSLVEDWSDHMKKLDKNDYRYTFTKAMKKNVYLNFTKFIQEDMKTFLIAVAGDDRKHSTFYYFLI